VKIFLDTNVFLDIALKRANFQEALLILKAVKNELFEGVVADISIVNIHYIASKSGGDVNAYLQMIENYFSIVGADNRIVREALALNNSDIEDNIQYLLAHSVDCEVIVTNDKGFYRDEIELLNSFEFVEKFLK
jgi:predicted nucleic acid-binding protein